MIKSKIYLISLILDEPTFKYTILSLEDNKIKLPHIEISPFLDLVYGLSHLTSLYIENHNDIIHNYRLSDIIIRDELEIYYYLFIPHDVKLTNAYKIPLSPTYEFNLPNFQKIVWSIQDR